MKMLLRVCVTAALLLCYMLLTHASENKKTKGEGSQSGDMSASSSNIKAKGNNTTAAHDRRSEVVVPRKKLKMKMKKKKTGSIETRSRGRGAGGCTRLGGVCQPDRFICPGRYLKDKCPGSRTQQCCLPVGAWSVLCAGHHNNRVRACDTHGCGAFNSRRGNSLYKAVDLVCDDYGIVNAPFSGNLAGPVSRRDPEGNQYDGVKLLSDVDCVKIFNLRPYRYAGAVAQGEALGYLLPLQERFSGITSHLQLQRCDGSDPSPFI